MNNILNLFNNMDDEVRKDFSSSVKATANVAHKSNNTIYDDEWLVKMEETIKYIDNILRAPNRFIINEEEIVKIELARRITVDSIKHLSKNTSLIQKYDPKTDEVKPSKILNINKEESFNTYENRFIYTLINNMKMYIERKKTESLESSARKEHFSLEYRGTSKVGKEKIELALQLKSDIDDKGGKGVSIADRITKVEERITDLCSAGVYRDLARLHVSPVTSPIKKTNLILKNVNFQYALELWNYMQAHMTASSKNEKKDDGYEDKGALKQMMNDSFLLDYLIMKSAFEKQSDEAKEDLQNKVASNTVNQLLSIRDNLSIEEIMKLIGDEYIKVKYQKVVDTSMIEKKYREAIEVYMAKDHDLKVRSVEKNNKQ